ncbi:hypothetical protein Tco_0718263, partial [Tanacetum coccineum]
MESIKKLIDERALHTREYDSRVNERLMQTTEEKVDTSKALDASLVDTERQHHTEQPEFNNEGLVDQNAKQCHDIHPLPAKLTDNQITELLNQSLKSENICLKKTAAQFQKDFSKLEAHCINLELQLQNNVLKSGQHGQLLKDKCSELDLASYSELSTLFQRVTTSELQMANLSEDIQCAGSDTRPPMLDRTDFASWQQRIRLYCRGKENGVNILKSIDEGPFLMGAFQETLAEDKEKCNADIRATNILLQGLPKDIYSLINHYTDAKDIWDNVKMLLEGSELTKEDRESQLYDDFEHFRQHKGETIHDYYVRFAKLINDMRNIKMTMSRMQLNSKFVNNMLPEWGRFITPVKLNRGLRDSNYDQLYVYLKKHEAHANENKMMLERFTQPNVDPLALMSNVSHQQYNSQSSTHPSSTYLPSTYVSPHFANNTQLDSGLSPSDNLIENLTNTLALLTQSYKTVNKIEDRGTMHGVQVQLVMGELRTELGMLNQVKQGRLSATTTTENGVALDEEQLLFIAGGQDNAIDEDVDEQPVQDLALNVDNVFQADDCDAFDSDVDEAPMAQTMFMANLSSVDPVYDEAGPSYDSDILSEVHDHDHYQDAICEHHEEHKMHDDVQPTYVVDSHANYTSDSNMIPYDQYVKDNAVPVVQSNVSYVPNDAYMMIFNDMHEPHAQSVFDTTRNTVVDNSLTAYTELGLSLTFPCSTSLTHTNKSLIKTTGLLFQKCSGSTKLEDRGTMHGCSAVVIGGAQNRAKEMRNQALGLKRDNVFQADDCDAFDSDVDEAPIAHTMFMANLSSVDLVYDEASPSYDSNILSEVYDHDHYQDAICKHHKEHKMHDDVQPTYVVDSHANYTSDSNMILYDQYVKDNAVPVVQSNVSYVPNDAYMMIFNDMHEPHALSVSDTTQNTIVDNLLTAELATYKEQVELYERRAMFELTEREQKIDEQLRIVITDRNIKEANLKKELHSKENKYLEEFLDMKALKEKVEDKLYKQDQSLQTVHMLCKPKPYYNKQNKIAIGYKNPLCLTRAKQVQPALYNGYEIIKNNHVPALVHNTEDTLEIAKTTRRKMNDKIKDPECVTHKVKIAPPDFSKENYLVTFTTQKQLTPEQIFWSQYLIKMKVEALKKHTTTSRPIKELTVYSPNTPATLVPRVLPTKSQVKINIFTLIQLFLEFEKTYKKRITPTGLTEGERGFEQTKECYITEVILFFKTLKEHFKGIQKVLTKEIKEIKDIFEELEAEVDQNVVNRKHDEIERKNLLIANDNLIFDCLSKEVFYIATNSELSVSRFTKMHEAHTFVQTRYLELKLKYQNLKESFGNDPSPPTRDTPDFDSVFVIKKMKASIQGKDSAIKKLRTQISQLKDTHSEADRTLDFKTLDFLITKLTEKVYVLQEQNEIFRAENEK